MIYAVALVPFMATRPDWFTVTLRRAVAVEGDAQVPVPGGSDDFRIGLEIACVGTVLSVRERAGSDVRPRRCPDRHVNADGSFCLGMDVTQVADRDEAIVWWGLLREYLLLQRTAARTRTWPAGQFIAHGDAGPYHLRARSAAAALGILDQYDEAVAGAPHWLSDGSVRLSKDRLRLVNGRAACPMGCRGRCGRPRLRTECCRRCLVFELVLADAMRRELTELYWKRHLIDGVPCCGTLRECPLRRQ
jgi:hypothetical protein